MCPATPAASLRLPLTQADLRIYIANYLPNAGITGVHHYNQSVQCWDPSQSFVYDR